MTNSITVSDELGSQPECQHHWVIDSARGPTSWGFCRRCSATREFTNSCPGVIWEDGALSDILRTSSASSLWWQKLQPLRVATEDETQSVGVDAC
jgi:hypothetical protein